MYINNPGHSTKMTAMPMVKTLQKSSTEPAENRWINLNETWHKALMANVLQRCYVHV